MRAERGSSRLEELELEALEKCRAGYIEGLEVLYTLHSQRVFRTCLRVLGDRSDAEDATQEVFLRLHAKASQFDRRASFTTWLYRLSVNHCLNRLRSRRAVEERSSPLETAPEPAATSATQTGLLAEEERSLLHDLLGGLSAEHRAAVVLRDIEGLAYREIAEVLQIPAGTVMSRLHRARRQLKEIWADRRAGSTESAGTGRDSRPHASTRDARGRAQASERGLIR